MDKLQEATERIKKSLGDFKAVAKGKSDKAKGKVRAIAERLMSAANAIGDAPPNPAQLKDLKSLHAELGAAIGGYPSPKRATKSVEMTPAGFQAFATSEIGAATAEQDTERVELLESNLAEARKQMEEKPDTQTITVKIFSDEEPPAEGGNAAASLADQINQLSESISTTIKALTDKAKQAPGEEEEEEGMPGKKKPGEEESKAKKPACKGEGGEAAQDGGDQTGDETGDQTSTEKADAWPRDLNVGRTMSEAERWGMQKSLSDEDRSFGPDPVEETAGN